MYKTITRLRLKTEATYKKFDALTDKYPKISDAVGLTMVCPMVLVGVPYVISYFIISPIPYFAYYRFCRWDYAQDRIFLNHMLALALTICIILALYRADRCA